MHDQVDDRSSMGDVPDGAVDVLVVGAGFAGLYLVHRLRREGWSVRCIEAGGGVGGTWYWNRYPGARCDVHSVEYSYSFDEELQAEWTWSERYATQPEILRYLEHVADRFDLHRHITLHTRVTGARWDEAAHRWVVDLVPSGPVGAPTEGERSTVTARFLILATGCLSVPNVPDIAGLDDFAGECHHTARWPHEGVDVAGKRVGVIGNGSSGIQVVPELARQAEHLTVFQRTAAWTVPARNQPLDEDYVADLKARYREFRADNLQRVMAFSNGTASDPKPEGALTVDAATRAERFAASWERGGFSFMVTFADLMVDRAANAEAARFVADRIAEEVGDPRLAAALVPSQLIGCKRICLDSGYYRTFARPDVSLVDVARTPIERVVPDGIVAGPAVVARPGADVVPNDDGTVTHRLDVLVLATGFDAMTGAITAIDPVGRGGRRITEAWAAGPITYLGLQTAGFPNLFHVTGPGSPSVLTNMVMSIEHHVDWIARALADLRAHGLKTIEPTEAAAHEWAAHVNAVAEPTLYPRCSSWYLGANVPGKPRVFMPLIGFPTYVERCTAVANAGYEGFIRV